MAVGLSEAEAAARLKTGQSNTTFMRPHRTVDLARRESVFTIFHLNMLGLMTIQILMRQYLSALITLGLGLGSILLGIIQDRIAEQRFQKIKDRLRPRSVVIRDGNPRNIDSDQIVVGDLIVVGPGDQFQVDGRVSGDSALVVDSGSVGKPGWHRVSQGDEVLAGAHCVSGRGYYVAERVGNDRFVHAKIADTANAAARQTPLERLIARVLLSLLLVVVVFIAVLLAKYFRLEVGAPGDALIDAAPVIFSLLPTGLYLMIIRTYISGTAQIARRGAIVNSARSVEALAEADIICFTDVDVLAGIGADIVPAEDLNDAMSPSQLRQLLGDFSRSVADSSPISVAIAESFEGVQRAVAHRQGELASLGWSAIQFTDDPFLYVLGTQNALEHLLAPDDAASFAATSSNASLEGTEMLLVARSAGAWGGATLVQLPSDLEFLGLATVRRTLHPDSVEVIRAFVAAGVRIKLFAGQEVANVIEMLQRAGLSATDRDQLIEDAAISRADWEGLDPAGRVRAAQTNRVFGGFLPEQVADIVRILRANGKHVAVVGDALSDLPALKAAQISVVHPTSAQAAVNQADLVMLDSSLRTLLVVLQRGQSMVRGLLDLINLNLSLVVASALLIIVVRLLGVGFPYQGGHGGIISILALTVPSVLLPFWTRPGRVDSADHRGQIARFVVPAGVLLGATGFGVYLEFLDRYSQVALAQMAVAYTLLYGGLTLTVLIQPPVLVAGHRQWNATIMAATLAVIGTSSPYLPKGTEWFRATTLPSINDYLLVFAAVGLWTIALKLVWRLLAARRESNSDTQPVAHAEPSLGAGQVAGAERNAEQEPGDKHDGPDHQNGQ